jgi:integrase
MTLPIQKGSHRYKEGKIMEPMSFQEIQKRVQKVSKHLTVESLAYFWLLYYTGCRKSEGYERKVSDVKLTDSHFIIDFGQRKKGGAKVPPLKLSRDLLGVDLLVQQFETAGKRKPSKKIVQVRQSTEEMRKTTKGMKPILKNVGIVKREQWLFPHMNSTGVWRLMKRILGDRYYPHFLRLNALTEIATDPTVNLDRMKSFSGIKSIDALQEYLGTSEKEQDAALSWREKQQHQNKKGKE